MHLFGHSRHHRDDPFSVAPSWAVEIHAALEHIIERLDTMAKTLDQIIQQANDTLAQVTKNTDLDQSIIGIMNGQAATLKDLRAQLAAAGTDAAKLQQLGDAMDTLAAKATAEGQVTADAVTANTPAA